LLPLPNFADWCRPVTDLATALDYHLRRDSNGISVA